MRQNFAQWNVGDVILDLYKVTDILGEGGFGKVYKVRHQGWNIDLAVKIPKPEIIAAAGSVENFEREAETWVNLGLHPHTVSCYYVRRIDESPTVFAEYVAGGSLHDWIESRRLYGGGANVSLRRILDIAIQFAWGLHYAHEQGLIHQDVKPGNVMITAEGVVKVTDFGLANVQNAAAIANNHEETPQAGKVYDSTLMVAGSGAMTPAYCSPEQANGDNLTRRTDLWSWALSVLEMFQGERTWQHGAVAAGALEYYLESVCEYSQLPQMPILLAQLLRRCFRENSLERPHDMLFVANELQDIYHSIVGKAYLRQLHKTGRDIADSLNNRALSLLDLGKQSEALQLWEQALKVQPHHPESTYNRGLILWRMGRINDDVLIVDMEQVQQSHKGNWVADYLIAEVHLERDDCKAAIRILESIQGKQLREVQTALGFARKRLPQSRRLLYTFEGHVGAVNSICFSSDNQFALSGSDDKTLTGKGESVENENVYALNLEKLHQHSPVTEIRAKTLSNSESVAVKAVGMSESSRANKKRTHNIIFAWVSPICTVIAVVIFAAIKVLSLVISLFLLCLQIIVSILYIPIAFIFKLRIISALRLLGIKVLIEQNPNNPLKQLMTVSLSLLTLTFNIEKSYHGYASQLNPKDAETYNKQSDDCLKLGDISGAIENLTRVIQINPNYTEAYSKRGDLLSRIEQYQAAIHDYTWAISLNPKDLHSYNNRGQALCFLGDYQGAIEDYIYAIQLNPNVADVYYNCGNAYNCLGNYQKAIENYSLAIYLNHFDGLAYFHRGLIYHQLGDNPNAKTDLLTAAEFFRNECDKKNYQRTMETLRELKLNY